MNGGTTMPDREAQGMPPKAGATHAPPNGGVTGIAGRRAP